MRLPITGARKLVDIFPQSFHSPWMLVDERLGIAWPRDGIYRGFIRWLYVKVLDELYLPKGTYAQIIEDNGRVLARPGQRDIRVSASSHSRKGVQEKFFFEEFGYKI